MNVFIPSDLFALNKLLNYVILRDVYCLLHVAHIGACGVIGLACECFYPK